MWVLVAVACVPIVGVFLYAGGVLACVLAAIFVVGIYVHYVRLSQRRAPLSDTIYSGGCLLPVLAGICAVVVILAGSAPREPVLAVLCVLGILVAIAGAMAGYLTAVLIEAGRSAWACIWVLRRKRRRRIRKAHVPWGEERDTELLPLEMPLSYFLPRRFGVRGMMVLVTLASMLTAALKILGVSTEMFLAVLIFVAGVLSGQVLLFRGRKPLAASAWGGAFLLPGIVVPVAIANQIVRRGTFPDAEAIMGLLLGSTLQIPVGIVLGSVIGVLAGGVYALAESRFRRLFQSSPRIDLVPFTGDDIELLLAWLRSPKLLRRWAGG